MHGKRSSNGDKRPPSEGLKVQAPAMLIPKFFPDGPSVTVPVLGCPFPEVSYMSLANQPSSRAKQGDVRFSSVSLVAYAPMASMPSTYLGISLLLAGPLH